MEIPTLRKCQGLPQIGTRALTPDEITWLRQRLVAHAWRRKGYRVLSWSALVATLIGSGVLLQARVPSLSEPSSIFGFAFASAAIGMFAAGAFGALGEVIFGFHRGSQVFFALAWLVFGLTFVLDLPSSLQRKLAVGAFFVGLFGGSAMMLLRFAALRSFARLVPDVQRDLANGIVWQFAGETRSWEEDENEDEADDEPVEAEHHSVEVLPLSKLALRIDGAAPKDGVTLLVTGPPA